MNIIQLHQRVKFWLDHKFSPRFRLSDYDDAINVAILDIVKDRIGNVKQLGKPYSIQSSQVLREELYTLIKMSPNLYTPTQIASSVGYLENYPPDHYLLLNLFATINGKEYVCYPTNNNEYDQLIKDPFKRARLSYPDKVYNIESSDGQKIIWGESAILNEIKMQYLSKPVEVSSGVEIKSGAVIPIGTQLISTSDKTVHLNVTYPTGVAFTVQSSASSLTSGSAVYNYVNQNTAIMLEEEIAKASAAILNKITEDYNKGKMTDYEQAKV